MYLEDLQRIRWLCYRWLRFGFLIFGTLLVFFWALEFIWGQRAERKHPVNSTKTQNNLTNSATHGEKNHRNTTGHLSDTHNNREYTRRQKGWRMRRNIFKMEESGRKMRLLPGYSQTEKMRLIPVQSKTERNAFTSGTMQDWRKYIYFRSKGRLSEVHLVPDQSKTGITAFTSGWKQGGIIYLVPVKARRRKIHLPPVQSQACLVLSQKRSLSVFWFLSSSRQHKKRRRRE